MGYLFYSANRRNYRASGWHSFFASYRMATKKTVKKKSAAKKKTATPTRRWSAGVTKNSNALDLEKGVFTSGDPKKVARSLERSAAQSRRRKAGAYQSAMSMLNFYINRAGKNLPASKKKILLQAKEILKEDHAKQVK